MKKATMLLIAAWRRQKGIITGVFSLVLMLSLCLFTSVTLYYSGEISVSAEMDRLGFGDYTAWVSGDADELLGELETLDTVERFSAQELIFAGYEIGGKYSDDEGQLIVFTGDVPYRFMDESGAYVASPEIVSGDIYISPALKSNYDVSVGDTVRFELSRSNGVMSFTVAGYFADAFMGSSMIDMKSFLISETDREKALQVIASAADYDVLGKTGAMLHIFKADGEAVDDAAFQRSILKETSLSVFMEFAHSRASILSYMLLLQSIMTGFLTAFSVVLFLISLIVVGHSLSASIEQSKRDMAVLKTIGLSGTTIRTAWVALYGGCIALGATLGLSCCFVIAGALARMMLTSTGMLIDITLPAGVVAVIWIAIPAIFTGFLLLRTSRILSISPMETIRESVARKVIHSGIRKSALSLCIALRELLSNQGKYVGACLIAVLLVVFLSIIGRMGAWLGPNGEGLMNAFSVADHDLGVQPMNETVDMDEIERVIESYSPIIERYALAMQSVTVNGREYTANVLDDATYFHVLDGVICDENGILITDAVAGEQGLSIGDRVSVVSRGRRAEYTVSGIYQCANGMGANIGMSRAGYARIADVNGYIWCRHYILRDGQQRDAAMQFLQETYRGIDVHTNAWSGLDGIVWVMRALIALIYLISALFIMVTVLLVTSKLLRSETGDMAIYKSVGLTSGRLRLSFALRFLIAVALGSLVGILTAAFTADGIIGRILSLFGIGSFTSRAQPLSIMIPPLMVPMLFFGFAWLFSAKIKRVSLVKLIMENDQ